jgi:hypothetical protein
VRGDHVEAFQAQVERHEADDVHIVVGDQHHVAHIAPGVRPARKDTGD